MVIGYDHIHPLGYRVIDSYMVADPRIAGQQQIYPASNYFLEHRQVYPVGFTAAQRDMVLHIPSQCPQAGDQQGRGGLPINIKIPPHADAFSIPECGTDAPDSLLHAFQLVRRGRLIQVWVEESLDAVQVAPTPSYQDLGYKRLPTNSFQN
jgi:hypothetical protein